MVTACAWHCVSSRTYLQYLRFTSLWLRRLFVQVYFTCMNFHQSVCRSALGAWRMCALGEAWAETVAYTEKSGKPHYINFMPNIFACVCVDKYSTPFYCVHHFCSLQLLSSSSLQQCLHIFLSKCRVSSSSWSSSTSSSTIHPFSAALYSVSQRKSDFAWRHFTIYINLLWLWQWTTRRSRRTWRHNDDGLCTNI